MGLFSRKSSRPIPPNHSPASPASVEIKPGVGTANGSTAPGTPESAALEARTKELGVEMLSRARGHKTGLLSAKFYSDALMEWSMKDPAFKVQMFRFVDAFPMLRDAESIYDHLQDYLSQPGVTVPTPIAAALKAGSVMKSMAAGTISKQITGMASKFIAGTDAKSALPNLKSLWNDGIAFSVDLLGEACVSDEEADGYQAKYLDLVQNLPGEVSGWKGNERLETDHLGAIPRTNVSVKISSLSPRCDPIDPEGAIKDLRRRLDPILANARKQGGGGVFVNFDMEQFSLKDLTLDLFMRCCEANEAGAQGGLAAGLAMQAYLRSGPDDARRICEWAKRTGRVVTVRLVKGAYWDYEVINAEQRGWAVPVWTSKRESDACFERMAEIFLDATPRKPGEGGVKLALGSHNVRSIAAALAGLERRGLPRNAIELQMLHGMADALKYAAAEMGLRIREYVPVGEMIPGMAYLVRRLLENTSNESWLKAGFLDNADPEVLLKSPHVAPISQNGSASKITTESLLDPSRHMLTPADVSPGVGDGKPFINEEFRDFSKKAEHRAFGEAVAKAAVPNVPNDRTVEQAREMVRKAAAYFPTWRDTDPKQRADVLVKAAALMRQRRDELSGVMVKESGKTWREADADTCEAIDFCEYYARLAVGLFKRERIGRYIGELDEQWYQPRGVAAVISPWNFPLAICCGMTTAALVTGNTVVVKPAEQTPGIAKLMVDILHQAGAPKEALHFCPAPGETVGAALVRDPRVAVIAFTGSKAVGLDIIQAAGITTPEQQSAVEGGGVKKVICEMGGKNALIIDTSADLDEAVLAARYSAFGFQGQKCSALSRLIVVDREGPGGAAITHVVHRLVEATRALTIGDPTRCGTDVGPVIDQEAADKIRHYIDAAKKDGNTLALAMQPPAAGVDSFVDANRGRFVGPHIFTGVKPEHTIAREEIFGPVLAVLHASSFDEALAMANASPYKLTGGVFSRKPSHLEKAKRELRVGNLYLNRGITGALVARQPFGGFGMSGVGSKAGGRDYLLQFVEPRASCENTLRRGFAPEL